MRTIPSYCLRHMQAPGRCPPGRNRRGDARRSLGRSAAQILATRTIETAPARSIEAPERAADAAIVPVKIMLARGASRHCQPIIS